MSRAIYIDNLHSRDGGLTWECLKIPSGVSIAAVPGTIDETIPAASSPRRRHLSL